MRSDIVLEPVGEDRIGDTALLDTLVLDRAGHKIRRGKIGGDARIFGGRQIDRIFSRCIPIGLDLIAEFVDAMLIDQDLDARLVEVVAAPMEIVNAQDRLDVGEQMLLLEERPDLLADVGRAAHAATDKHAEAVPAFRSAHDAKPDVVKGGGGAILGCA